MSHEGIWAEYRTPYRDEWKAANRMGDLVRCRDCKHYVIYETWNPKGEKHHCNSFGQDTDAYGFCAWGERK